MSGTINFFISKETIRVASYDCGVIRSLSACIMQGSLHDFDGARIGRIITRALISTKMMPLLIHPTQTTCSVPMMNSMFQKERRLLSLQIPGFQTLS